MTWSKPKNSMLKKTAFSTSGDARKLRVNTKKTRPTGCCMIDVSRAGGVVTEEVRVKKEADDTNHQRRADFRSELRVVNVLVCGETETTDGG